MTMSVSFYYLPICTVILQKNKLVSSAQWLIQYIYALCPDCTAAVTSALIFLSSLQLHCPVHCSLLTNLTTCPVFKDLSKRWQSGCEINTSRWTSAALTSRFHWFQPIWGRFIDAFLFSMEKSLNDSIINLSPCTATLPLIVVLWGHRCCWGYTLPNKTRVSLLGLSRGWMLKQTSIFSGIRNKAVSTICEILSKKIYARLKKRKSIRKVNYRWHDQTMQRRNEISSWYFRIKPQMWLPNKNNKKSFLPLSQLLIYSWSGSLYGLLSSKSH